MESVSFFDMRTVWVVTVGTYLMFGLLQLAQWYLRRGFSFLLFWGFSYLAGAISSALLVVRGIAPDWISISVANGVTVLGYGFMHAGLRIFDGCRLTPAGIWAPAVLCGLSLELMRLMAVPSGVRVAFMAVVFLLYCLVFWFESIQSQKRDELKFRFVVQIAFIAGIVLSLIRLAAVTLDTQPVSLLNPTPALAMVSFISIGLVMYWCLALLLVSTERIEKRLTDSAHNDALTGLLNRRGFYEQGEPLLERLLAANRPAALVVLDIDYFKKINDRHGHEAGDLALEVFAQKVRKMIKSSELFARLGGEEFCLLLPETSLEEATDRANAIRESLSDIAIPLETGKVTFTVSGGVSIARAGPKALQATIRQADRALYLAKRQGRNRICSATDLLQVTGLGEV